MAYVDADAIVPNVNMKIASSTNINFSLLAIVGHQKVSLVTEGHFVIDHPRVSVINPNMTISPESNRSPNIHALIKQFKFSNFDGLLTIEIFQFCPFIMKFKFSNFDRLLRNLNFPICPLIKQLKFFNFDRLIRNLNFQILTDRVPSRAHSDGSAGNSSAALWNFENFPAGSEPIKVIFFFGVGWGGGGGGVMPRTTCFLLSVV
jgi:hypothetical protein